MLCARCSGANHAPPYMPRTRAVSCIALLLRALIREHLASDWRPQFVAQVHCADEVCRPLVCVFAVVRAKFSVSHAFTYVCKVGARGE